MRRLGMSAILVCSLIALSPLRAQDASDYKANPKFQDAMKEAKQLEKQQRYVFAVDAYKKANKLAAGRDIDCLQALKKSLAAQRTENPHKRAAADEQHGNVG